MIMNDTLPWTYDLDQATRLQENLSKRLLLTWDNRPVTTVAGIDTSDAGETIHAAITVFHYPGLTRMTTVTGKAPQGFPYISGLLAFRIGPAILDAWDNLKLTPDLIIIHGHGIAHPRHLGLASHVALWLNIPTIGVARTNLYGHYAEVGPQVGDYSEIQDDCKPDTILGAALRTQLDTKPIIVSAGHLIDLPHSISFVLACIGNYRMPEPVRVASQAAQSTNKIAESCLAQHDTGIQRPTAMILLEDAQGIDIQFSNLGKID